MKETLKTAAVSMIVFVLIWLYRKCVPYISCFIFDRCVSIAMSARNYGLNRYMPFILAYTEMILCIGIFSWYLIDHIIPYMVNNKALEKRCLSGTHRLFFAQLLSMACVMIIPGYYMVNGSHARLMYMAFTGLSTMVILTAAAYAASKVNQYGVMLIWGMLTILCFGEILLHFEEPVLAAAAAAVTMFTLPLCRWSVTQTVRLIDRLYREIRIQWLYEETRECMEYELREEHDHTYSPEHEFYYADLDDEDLPFR